MITHSQTGLTPPTASVFAVLFLISVSWPLPVFPLQIVSIPQCSCPCHSGVKSRQSGQQPEFLRLLFTEQAFTALRDLPTTRRAVPQKYNLDYYKSVKLCPVIATIFKPYSSCSYILDSKIIFESWYAREQKKKRKKIIHKLKQFCISSHINFPPQVNDKAP